MECCNKKLQLTFIRLGNISGVYSLSPKSGSNLQFTAGVLQGSTTIYMSKIPNASSRYYNCYSTGEAGESIIGDGHGIYYTTVGAERVDKLTSTNPLTARIKGHLFQWEGSRGDSSYISGSGGGYSSRACLTNGQSI